MALVIFVALFVVSITMADFCYLGPSKVLTQRAEGNEYAGYYLSAVSYTHLTLPTKA